MEINASNNCSFRAILAPQLRNRINAYRTGIRQSVAISHKDWLAGNYLPDRAIGLDILKRLKVFSAQIKFLSPRNVIQEDFYLDGRTSLLSQETRKKFTGNITGIPQINIEVLEEVARNLKKLG